MDPALLKDRHAFLKRAKANPVVEKRKKDDITLNKASKKPKLVDNYKKEVPSTSAFNYKTAQASSQLKFSILAKIVKHMKERHKQGDTFPLTVDEILEETNQVEISPKIINWLDTEALKNNPKIDQVDGNKYVFKPVFNIRDRKGLLKLLKSRDLKGHGGILQDDIEESVPNAAKALKMLGESILYVTRQNDKKKVLFYNDKELQFSVEEDFQKLWRSVSVEGVDERKIEEYLDKQGINSMQDLTTKKIVKAPKRKQANRKRATFKALNEHLDGVLQDYSQTNIGDTKT